MAPYCKCPECGQDISYTYESYDPDAGIMSSAWYCDACNVAITDEGEPDYDE